MGVTVRLSVRFEWHIVPLVNPEGYEFSRLKNDGLCPEAVRGRNLQADFGNIDHYYVLAHK